MYPRAIILLGNNNHLLYFTLLINHCLHSKYCQKGMKMTDEKGNQEKCSLAFVLWTVVADSAFSCFLSGMTDK